MDDSSRILTQYEKEFLEIRRLLLKLEKFLLPYVSKGYPDETALFIYKETMKQRKSVDEKLKRAFAERK
jgi:hypothetical protein